MTQHLILFLLTACIGITVEVLFTALADFRKTKDHRLAGHSYVWMFPLYGMAYVLFVATWPYTAELNILLRGLVYVGLVYVFEYTYGHFIRRFFGASPWEHKYRKSRWHIHGHIRLDYAPLWFIFALSVEQFYVYLLY